MAEIILEPTALSKVIPLKFKINDVDVPKTTQLSTNKQFNTTDTDAWFTFELDGLASASGTYDLTLINLDDKSIFNHADVIFSALPFHYKLNSSEDVTLNEIRHAGRWLGQLVVTMSNGDTTARQFGFNISGHILDGQDAQVILLSDYQALINTINLAKDDLTQYNVDYAALLVDIAAAEDARVTAEADRTTAFADAQTARTNAYTAAEAARDADFDEAESGRATAETGRVSAESDRVTAETNRVTAENNRVTAESNRVTAESGRVTAESNRVTAESNRATTFSTYNGRITALESKAVKQYGARRSLNASSTLLERLGDGVGLVANVPTDDSVIQNDFDAIYPFSHMRECIIDATGRIHYKGDPTYAAAVGDWMVEVPLYYVKDVRTATTQDEYFSAFKLDGYRIPKDFIREDGTVCQKIYYGRFKTGKDGTTDVSRPGLLPSNYRDLASFRTGARAKGAGWQEVGINYVKDFLHKLTKVEFANLNSQTVFGPGITNVRYTATDTAVLAETAVNRFVTTIAIAANFNVGNVINIGTTLGGNNVASMRVITAINVLGASNSEIIFDGAAVNIAIGNIIAMVAQKTGQTVNLQKPSGKLSGISGRTSFKWRGIEDPFGNLYEWVDGVLINDNKGYICNKPSLFASTLTADYKPLNYTNANTNGYPFEMGYDENYPEAQFPITVGAGSSTGYADYYYQNTGLRGAFFGGHATFGAGAGLFFWLLSDSPSYASWSLGGRLLFKPPAV